MSLLRCDYESRYFIILYFMFFMIAIAHMILERHYCFYSKPVKSREIIIITFSK